MRHRLAVASLPLLLLLAASPDVARASTVTLRRPPQVAAGETAAQGRPRSVADLLDAATQLEAEGRRLLAEPGTEPRIRAVFLETAEPLAERLRAAGLNPRSLAALADQVRLQVVTSDAATRRALATGDATARAEVRPDRNGPGLSFENTAFVTAGDNSDTAASDLLRAKAAGMNASGTVSYALVVQNRDTAGDHHTAFIETPDYLTAVPEARLTLKPHATDGLTLDAGRYHERLAFGTLYEGFVDGVRANFECGKWNASLSSNSLRERFEQAGLGQLSGPVADSMIAGLTYAVRGGFVGVEALTSSLAAGPNGAAGIPTVSSRTHANDFGTMGDVSWLAAKAAGNLSQSLHAEGWVGRQDIENYDAKGTLGRSFWGLDAGANVTYSEPGVPGFLYARLHTRELDVLSLGRADDLFATEYFNNRLTVYDAFGNAVVERFANSLYGAVGAERPIVTRLLPRPLTIRIQYESIAGADDLDLAISGKQDGVFDQDALALFLGYRTPGEWNLLARVRYVMYRPDDFELRKMDAFRVGSSPADRTEFDLRVVSPLF